MDAVKADPKHARTHDDDDDDDDGGGGGGDLLAWSLSR